ncbi:MAG: amino acid ABC transporter substrate-binding protein [Roseobacter sp.]
MRLFFTAVIASLLMPMASSAQTLERIKETGTLNLGFRTDAAPLSFLEDNSPQGYAPTVCFALAGKIGAQLGLTDLDVIFTPVSTEDRFEKIEQGDIDLLCGASTITLSRLDMVDFSIPTYVDGATVALKAGGPETLEGLAGHKIGVRSGTTTFQALENSLKSREIAAEIIQFDDHPSGMAALDGDLITAYFADQSILMNMIMGKENVSDYTVLQELLTVEKHGLALPKGDRDFRLSVDKGLSELFSDGSMQKIFESKIPGAQMGFGLKAMFLLSPTLP